MVILKTSMAPKCTTNTVTPAKQIQSAGSNKQEEEPAEGLLFLHDSASWKVKALTVSARNSNRG